MESGVPCHANGLTEANEQGLAGAIRSDVPVLITSKDPDERGDCAQSIHIAGRRHSAPFVKFDCALPAQDDAGRHAIESVDDRAADLRRRFREALRGTLFVDRIEMMSQGGQAFLMSMLAAKSRHEDAPLLTPRIITGSNGSLLTAVAAGSFNEALLYRLNVIHLDFTDGFRRGGRMKVRELMSTPPQTCRADANLGAIARVMWNHDCGFMPLVDGSGKVVGVITDRDICIATATRHRLPDSISAAETTTGQVYACMPDERVIDALATMKEFKVRRLPVVDATGQLQGVISINDIVLASEQNRKPTPAELVSAIAAICAHRPVQTIAT
jgi:CBS domain-containing protein